jgi:putative hemolysin
MCCKHETVLGLLIVAILLGVCSDTKPESNSQLNQKEEQLGQLANPASENCIKHGGKLIIEKRGDGGEYGICLFEDNRQCEEWAMLRGNCPVGGIKVTGYVTPAARYCAIEGGEYKITANSNMENEQGVCTFVNGKKCDVWEYFNGKCIPDG